MSTLNPPSKISTRRESRQDRAVTLYAKAWDYVDKHRPVVYGALAVLVLLVAGLIGWTIYHNQQAERAQELLGGIVSVYEQGTYRQALDGTENQPGLLEIADEYGGTQAGNMARFYAADALYQLGEYDRALQYFQAYDKEDNYFGASAYAGEAAVYENQGEYRRAGDLYQRAAETYDNEYLAPLYLEQAGRAYEEAGAHEEARRAYQRIEERYPDSRQAGDVPLYLARLEALQNE